MINKFESNPIIRGSRAMKIWKYISRIERLEKRGAESWSVGNAIWDTLIHLESLGVFYEDDHPDLIAGYYWDAINETVIK
jgi:hypothetical protein